MLPRILLVEDDEVIREIYAMKFELEGFPVAAAENGQVALGLVESFRPEVILLDMMMPVMGGMEFLQQLKNELKQDIEIIIFSNISAATQTQAVMQLGASDYWVKSDYTPERAAEEIMARWNDKKPK